MYDMYSWDQPASPADEQADARPADKPAPAAPATPSPHERAARAVQVALDRRDNGGDATPGRTA